MSTSEYLSKNLSLERKIAINFDDQSKPHICHFFTQAKFLEDKIYTEKTRKLRQNTQKIANVCVITAKYTVNCQFFALNL